MRIFHLAVIVAAVFYLLGGCLHAQGAWREIVTVEDVCRSHPGHMEALMDHLDLGYPGLEKVKAAEDRGNLVEACTHLLAYYQHGSTAQHLRKELPEDSDVTVPSADTTLKDVFFVQNVRGQVPYGSDGHRDWYYKGPNNDREWAWLSNRHSQILSLLGTYLDTGNPKYAVYIDLFLRDFIIKSMPYPNAKGHNSIWRGLEVAARAKVWSRIFFGLLNSKYLSPATQLLMLSSLPDHAHYNRNFHGGNNWLTMEISALATVATNFPEYKASGDWLDYSISTMVESMKGQVYADGVQTELTSHYHNVSLRNFELFKNICDRSGKKLPDFYTQTIEDMYSYIAHAMRPDGFRILNNDGDRGSDRPLILQGAENFDKDDWTYIATNGTTGTRPASGPSFFYPWAGQLISRSGYDNQAHWSFFDIGPWGSGHQHNDKLHLSLAAFGRDILVDAGRFAYTGETARKFRNYAQSSAAHNLILLDQQGQGPGSKLADEPLGDHHWTITEAFDYASNSFSAFEDLDGEVEHIRSLFYVRGAFWVVVDRIITDRPRMVEAFWHWHPDCVVEKHGSTVQTNNDHGNLAIIPLSDHNFEVDFIKGQESPHPQGWYSPEYNIFEPNVASRFSTHIEGTATIVWLLLPAEHQIPAMTAEIVDDNDDVVLKIHDETDRWQLKIPFNRSQDAEMIHHHD